MMISYRRSGGVFALLLFLVVGAVALVLTVTIGAIVLLGLVAVGAVVALARAFLPVSWRRRQAVPPTGVLRQDVIEGTIVHPPDSPR